MTTPQRLYIPDGVQLALRLNQSGQPAAVVLGAVGTDSATPVTNEFAAAWRDAFWQSFRGLLIGTTECTGAVLRAVDEPDASVAEVGAPSTNAGGGTTGGAATAATSILIKWSTARGGRSGKGRTFLPGVSSGALGTDGRTYTVGLAGTVQTAVNAYLNHAMWTTYEARPAILSFTKGFATPITNGSLAPIVGIQRRRMRA